ncbi:MAG: hypothetical protein ACKOW9_06505 [Candidatus Paceibacterota bacterium]
MSLFFLGVMSCTLMIFRYSIGTVFIMLCLLKRSFRVILVLVLSIGLVPTSFASGSSKSRYGLEISKVGGYVLHPEMMLSAVPSYYVNKGVLYKPGTYADEVVYPMNKISPNDGGQSLYKTLDELYDVAVEPTNGYGRLPIEDAAYTYIMVTTPKGTRTITVYLPYYTPDNLSLLVGEEAAVARLKLAKVLNDLDKVTGRSSIYRPSTLEFWPVDRLFGSGSEAPVVIKQTPKKSSVDGCYTVRSSALSKALKNSLRFKFPDGKVASGFFRPALPGEKPCSRSVR